MKLRHSPSWKIFVIIAAVTLAITTAAASEAADKCAVVEKLERTVSAVRQNKTAELEVGSVIYNYDTIKTGQMGYAEIRFIDDTLMAIGPNSEVVIEDVLFDVKHKSFHVSIDRGSAWFATGSVGLANPGGVKFRTPMTMVSSSNASLQFNVARGRESINVHWLPKGGKATVYSVKAKKHATLSEIDMTLSIGPSGEMEIGTKEAEEDTE